MSTRKILDPTYRSQKEDARRARRQKVEVLDRQSPSWWARVKERFLAKFKRNRYGSSLYSPHQGEREKARRVRQLALGIIVSEHRFQRGYGL